MAADQNISARTLGEFFFTNASRHGEKICQIDATIDKKESFKSVKQRSVRLAIRLMERQIKSIDVVAICCENSLDNLIPVIATFYVGAIVVNLAPTLSSRHTRHLISMVKPTIIFVDSSSVKLINDSLDESDFKPEIIALDSGEFGKLLEPEENEDMFRPVTVDEEDVAILFFSSGTTGLPKAICHSHKNFLKLINRALSCKSEDDTVFLFFGNLYVISAMTITSMIFVDGSCRIFGHDQSPENILKIIEQYKVTSASLSMVNWRELANFEDVKKYDVSSLKLLTAGGAALPARHYMRLNDVFPHVEFIYRYGMTESGLISTLDFKAEREVAEKKVGTCGKVCAGVTLKVVDPNHYKVLSVNEIGEFRIKTPTLMVGFYNRPRSEGFDCAGFLKTGDLGYVDEDGFIYLVDRIKEMFKCKGFHIIPAMIEAVILEHPAVKEAAVFGVPDEEFVNLPAACVVLKENTTVSEEDIEKFVAQRVSNLEKLRGGVFIVNEELPKTPSGKVVRREIPKFLFKQ